MTYEESNSAQRIIGDRFRSFLDVRKGLPLWIPGRLPRMKIEMYVKEHSGPYSAIGVKQTKYHFYICHHVTENLMREFLCIISTYCNEWIQYRFDPHGIAHLTVALERILGGSFVSPYAKEEFDRIIYNILSKDSYLKSLLNQSQSEPVGIITIWAKGIKRWYKQRFVRVNAYEAIKNQPLAKIVKKD